jgi:hypothetical protein
LDEQKRMHRRLTIALVKNTIDSTFFRGMAEAILSSCFLCRRPPSAVRRGERRCFPLFPGGAAGMVEARMILLHRSSARSESDDVEEGV